METHEKIQKIVNKELSSRISSSIIIGDIESGKSTFLRNLSDIKYFDFEKESEGFFKNSVMTPLSFDLGKFFKEIKKIAMKSDKVLVIDNMELIANILYNRDGKLGIIKFFKDSINQVYKQNVIFVFSEIKEIRIEKHIKETGFPEKNIIRWGKKNEN
ncbi:MAG: hypothetical protein ACRC0Y_14665 [Fusobacteriaceae bacterium]